MEPEAAPQVVPPGAENLVNVVVVSNRVARTNGGEPVMGGLAAALLPAVRDFGAVWVGSSGKFHAYPDKDAFAEIEALGTGALATIDLPKDHYARYYEGFANGALWPTLHSRADLIHNTQEDYASYRYINAYMARSLLRFCRDDAIYWIQDYHFLTLALELRKLGIRQPIGFFLHTPWPPFSVVVGLPQHRELVQAMLAYNLIGFQTPADRRNFAEYLTQVLGLNVVDGHVSGAHGICQLDVFPIGIDADDFAVRASRAAKGVEVSRLCASLQSERLIIGVDRVDYSKGLTNRIHAFERLLTIHPPLRRRVRLLQIAVPSRCGIKAYDQLQLELSATVGEVNGRIGEPDWTPIRYLNKGFDQALLAGFYRVSQIGLVTPLHDGMNLVAKEYVAAQDPANPGVLVLSEFAGAANQLDAALLVNPHDIDGIAQALATALKMPREERIERWESMIEALRTTSLHGWFSGFVNALKKSEQIDLGKVPLSPDLPHKGAAIVPRVIGR
jgi:trehalose 6-phosphate synthase